MKKIINKILLKIMNKFNIPKLEISDKEMLENLEKYCYIGEQGEEYIVPNEQTKELEKIIFSDDIEKYRQVNGLLNDEGSKIFCQRVNDYLDNKGSEKE